MNIGNQISAIRKEQQLTQEQFGSLFHVTRQTVSNWENEKSYPDLQMLIDISNQFEISLDTLIKECIFRKNCASVPEERSAIPLQTEQSSASLLVAIIYSTIPARKFKTICLGCHSA